MTRNYVTYTLFLFMLLICINTSQQTLRNEEVEGYYWRDYAGFIPHDAFPGGVEKGEVTYIGQVLFNNLLLPAKILQSEETAYLEWAFKEYTSQENIKILCTENPNALKWLSSTSSTFKNIKSKRLIGGGYEPGSKLYIGRMNKTGDVLVGKLVVNGADNALLHSTKNGKPTDSEEFEVLYYHDPKYNPAEDTKGYYWRDYAGVIPHDALPAGKEGRHTTYISQILYNNLLVPGKIVESEKEAQFEWGIKARTAAKDIKIFCTDKPESFHWLKTNDKDFRTIKDKRFVVGSHEDNGILYIARINEAHDIVVGKLLVNEFVLFHGAYHNKPVQSLEFEVLYYDPPED